MVSPNIGTGSPYRAILEAKDLIRPAGEAEGGTSNSFTLLKIEPEPCALMLSGLALIGFKGGVAKFKPK